MYVCIYIYTCLAHSTISRERGRFREYCTEVSWRSTSMTSSFWMNMVWFCTASMVGIACIRDSGITPEFQVSRQDLRLFGIRNSNFKFPRGSSGSPGTAVWVSRLVSLAKLELKSVLDEHGLVLHRVDRGDRLEQPFGFHAGVWGTGVSRSSKTAPTPGPETGTPPRA
jgi:hypothetical protein